MFEGPANGIMFSPKDTKKTNMHAITDSTYNFSSAARTNTYGTNKQMCYNQSFLLCSSYEQPYVLSFSGYLLLQLMLQQHPSIVTLDKHLPFDTNLSNRR
jgi:hypothetical protein